MTSPSSVRLETTHPSTAIAAMQTVEEDVEYVPSFQREAVVTLLMVVSGGLTSFFGGMFYQFSPAWIETGANSTISNIWVTFVLLATTFGVEGVMAALSRRARQAL